MDRKHFVPPLMVIAVAGGTVALLASCDLMVHAVASNKACPWCASPPWLFALIFGAPLAVGSVVGVFLSTRARLLSALLITALTTVTGLLLVGVIQAMLLDFEPPESTFSICGQVLNSQTSEGRR
jgi:hypothetical protein